MPIERFLKQKKCFNAKTSLRNKFGLNVIFWLFGNVIIFIATGETHHPYLMPLKLFYAYFSFILSRNIHGLILEVETRIFSTFPYTVGRQGGNLIRVKGISLQSQTYILWLFETNNFIYIEIFFSFWCNLICTNEMNCFTFKIDFNFILQ